MKRALAIALVLVSLSPAWAKGKKGSDDDSGSDDDEASSSDDDAGTDDDDNKPAKKDKDEGDEDEKPKKSDKGDKGDKSDDEDKDQDKPVKQDLTGHDLGTKKKTTEFEKDRFYVDKTDTEKTEDHTLVQGSLASSSMYYAEAGGKYPTTGGMTGNDTGPDRMFTELRLQTDFRHIGGGRWDARIDGRARFVNTPDNIALTQPNHVQSGFVGQDEYDLRELWVVRNGERSDLFIGRQYIPDLGGLKIDGLRLDYASSNKLTLIGFGGLYPIRGSRSIDTDYQALKVPGSLDPAGQFVGAGGFGAAYRTVNTYGSLGGVALVPFAKEQARVYLTSSGYYRAGSKLDFYHFALIDVVGSGGFQVTNLSAGVNEKPTDRLRLTASINHVDTETLAIQAGAFLNAVDQQPGGATVVQNETFVRHLATDEARGSVSAGLGAMQRFQLSTAIAYRQRPAFSVITGNKSIVNFSDSAASVEVWGSLIDRHSIKDARIGIEGSQSFGVGAIPYQRNDALYLRGFVGHSIRNGRGEFVADVSYLNAVDAQKTSTCMDVTTCFGSAKTTLIGVSGDLYYRLREDWFVMGMLSVGHNTTTAVGMGAPGTDPAINSVTAFFRIAYRF